MSLRLFGADTAIKRKGASAPVKLYRANNLLHGDVLDFGSGQDSHGYRRFDPAYANEPALLLRTYDVVMCNYVLNVQPSEHLVTEILALLWHLARERVCIAVLCEGEPGTHAVGGGLAKGWREWDERIKGIYPNAMKIPNTSVHAWTARMVKHG